MHMVLSELSSSVRSFARSIKVVRAQQPANRIEIRCLLPSRKWPPITLLALRYSLCLLNSRRRRLARNQHFSNFYAQGICSSFINLHAKGGERQRGTEAETQREREREGERERKRERERERAGTGRDGEGRGSERPKHEPIVTWHLVGKETQIRLAMTANDNISLTAIQAFGLGFCVGYRASRLPEAQCIIRAEDLLGPACPRVGDPSEVLRGVLHISCDCLQLSTLF